MRTATAAPAQIRPRPKALPPKPPLLARTTRRALRHRNVVLAVWLVLLLSGGVASTHLSALLSNDFAVPGTDSARAVTILERRFGDRSDGEYLLVFTTRRPPTPSSRARLQATVDRAVSTIASARAGPIERAGPDLFYDTVVSQLDLAHAKADTPVLRRALHPPRGVRAYLSGQAAIQHDLDPVFKGDLRHGEVVIAIPAALLVLLFVLGVSWIVTLPLLFAGATIATTLGLVFATAHEAVMATYVTNLVELIGLALAVDYSLLVVYRFREELERGDRVDDAIVRTMTTAGPSVVFSGATVALGLALLVFIPVPFVRSLGIGGLLIPLVSIAAATTLLPALLSIYGRRGSARLHLTRRRRTSGVWHRLARSIMRRPLRYLTAGSAVLLLAAAPALALRLTPGSADGVPHSLPSVHGFQLLSAAHWARALSRRRNSWSTPAAPAESRPHLSGPRSRGWTRSCASTPRSRDCDRYSSHSDATKSSSSSAGTNTGSRPHSASSSASAQRSSRDPVSQTARASSSEAAPRRASTSSRAPTAPFHG
jgi:putative drug exporter of the RND superfamily